MTTRPLPTTESLAADDDMGLTLNLKRRLAVEERPTKPGKTDDDKVAEAANILPNEEIPNIIPSSRRTKC